jgi:hypothetical protein
MGKISPNKEFQRAISAVKLDFFSVESVSQDMVKAM